MSLKLKLKSVDELDDAIKALYKEKDGGFILNLSDEIPDVEALKTALNDERGKVSGLRGDLETANKKLKKMSDIDPERYKELMTLEKDLESKSKGWENMRDKLNETHQGEIKTLSTRATVLESELRKQMVTNSATLEIEKAGGSSLLLLPIIQNEARLVEENGKFHVRLFKDGNVDTPMIDNDGAHLTLGGRINEMKAVEGFGGAFKGSGASGGGKPPGDGGAGDGAPGNLNRSKMTLDEKTAFIEKHGQEKYLALPIDLASPDDAVGIAPNPAAQRQ